MSESNRRLSAEVQSDAAELQSGELVRQTKSIVLNRMADQQAGHGGDHIIRVLANARQIQSQTGGDLVIVELAALLHDLGDAKFHDGLERSAEFAREILTILGAERATIDHVAHIVDNISFRKSDTAEPLSLEGQIVQDADRLDALGAVGIVRTIEYGASIGQPFYLSNPGDQKTGIGHFDDKLFKLKSLINTDAGLEIAIGREKFMRDFIEQFQRENVSSTD